MLKQLIKLKLFAMAALLAAACAADGESPDEMTPDEPEPPPSEGVLLTDWVDSMVENPEVTDSVNDKPAFVINVEDPHAFDKYFAQ